MNHNLIKAQGHQLDPGLQLRSEDLVNEWMASIRSDKTRKEYTRQLARFAAWCKAQDLGMGSAKTFVIQKYINQLPGGPPSQAQALAAIRSFMSFCVRSGILESNPAREVITPKIEISMHKRKEAFTKDQVLAMIEAADNIRDKALVSVMADCGLRTIEIERADCGDLRQRHGSLVLFVQGKGRIEKDDFVPIGSLAVKYLSKYLKERTSTSDSDECPLFASEGNRTKGQRLTSRSISRIIRILKESAGIDDPHGQLTAHSLRHFCGNETFARTGDLDRVARYLRHSSTKHTKRYAREALDEDITRNKIDLLS